MKHILVLAAMMLLSVKVDAQTRRFGVEPGLRLNPMDRMIGPSVGFSISRDSRFSVLFREDGLISRLGLQSDGFYVVIFSTSLFIRYAIIKDEFHLGSGLTYVSRRNDSQLWGATQGYDAVSIFGGYQVRKIIMELRGEIPLGPSQRVISYGYLFPVTMAVHYHFDLKRRNNS